MCEMISAAGIPTGNSRREAQSSEGLRADRRRDEARAGREVHIRRTRRAGYQGMRMAHAAAKPLQPPRQRRLGGWYPRVHLGDGGAPRAQTRVRGENCTGTQTGARFAVEKKAEEPRRTRNIYRGRVLLEHECVLELRKVRGDSAFSRPGKGGRE